MTWGIANYSQTPGSNAAINGINIAPGCPSSSVGPALRQLMADIAAALASGQFTPAGQIAAFAMSTPPAGWLACDGSAVSRTTYANLFTAIGTTYGTGDGSTTFNVPDHRGRVIAGYDASNATGRMTAAYSGGVSAATVGNTGGEQGHALTTPELATHAHGVTDPTHAHSYSDPGHIHQESVQNSGGSGQPSTTGQGAGVPQTTLPATIGISINASATGITIQNTGAGTAHNVVQPTIVQLVCIKA